MRNKLLIITALVAMVLSPTLAVAEPGTLTKETMPETNIVEGIQAEITSPVTPDKNEIAAREIETNLVKIAEEKRAQEEAAAKAAAEQEAARQAQLAKAKRAAAVRTVAVTSDAGNADAIEYGRSRNAAVFGEAHWSALYQLWMRESGWRDTALNRSSGACGIPQFINGCVLGDHVSQIDRGLVYIQSRYGNPTNAWNFWLAHHWY